MFSLRVLIGCFCLVIRIGFCNVISGGYLGLYINVYMLVVDIRIVYI